MFFVQFEATPRANATTAPDVAGAFVNCWIVDQIEEAYAVDARDYPEGKDGREYFEQAQLDKEVFVFYRFPNEDSDPACPD